MNIHIDIHMASKTIMIDNELYEQLKKLKRDKSFSEIIRKLLNERSSPPKSSLGILKNENNKIIYNSIKKKRKEKDVSF